MTGMRRGTIYWGMFASWAADAVNSMGIKQAELATQLTTRLKRGIDAAAVNKILSGKRALAADEMLAIAEITGYPVLITLGGEKLDKENAQPPRFNEVHLVKLVSIVLEWRGVEPVVARNLSVALLGASRRHPDQQDIELSDQEARRIALALTEALGPQLQQ